MAGQIARIWLVVALAGCLLSLWGHMQIGLNNDHLVLMDQANKIMSGAIPYVDFTDVSPPLIHIIYMAPVMLSKLLGFKLADSLNLFTLALTGISLYLCDYILKKSRVSVLIRQLAASAVALALLGASFIHQVFADRDHLLMVLAAPWFVLYSPLANRDAVSLRVRIIVAILAAIGFAIKPYSYVFYAATLVFEHRQGKSWRAIIKEPEHWIVVGFAAAYVAMVFAFFPQYPLTMLPLGWKTYGVLSWDMHSKLNIVFYDLILKYAVVGGLATIALWVAKPEYCGRLFSYMYFLLAAAAVSYLFNGGWYYTQYPFIALALVLAVLAGAKLIEIYGHRPQMALVLAIGLWQFFVDPAQYRAGWDINLTRDRGHTLSTFEVVEKAQAVIDKELENHPRFMFLGTNIWATNFLKEDSPRQEVGRFYYLWPLPGILDLQDKPARQEDYRKLSAYLSGSITDDLKRHAPDLVINDVSVSQRGLPNSYNVLSFLMKDPEFSEAWKGYALAKKINFCTPQEQGNCAYEIYVKAVTNNSH